MHSRYAKFAPSLPASIHCSVHPCPHPPMTEIQVRQSIKACWGMPSVSGRETESREEAALHQVLLSITRSPPCTSNTPDVKTRCIQYMAQ